MDDYKKFAISVAREAGKFLKKKLSDKHVIDYKGEINIVTEADRMSEELIKSSIQRKYPHHDIKRYCHRFRISLACRSS